MKKFLISILAFIFIISAVNAVNAASGNINLSASSDTVVKGKTFTVTLAGTADNNITGLQSTLSYDTTKLSIEVLEKFCSEEEVYSNYKHFSNGLLDYNKV